MTTGRRARLPIVLGVAPKGLERQIADTRRLVASARDAVVDMRGKTGVHDESLLLELGQWEAVRRLVWHELTKQWASLTSEARASLARDSAKAATERTRCMKALGLNIRKADEDPWEAFHASQRQALLTPAVQAVLPAVESPIVPADATALAEHQPEQGVAS